MPGKHGENVHDLEQLHKVLVEQGCVTMPTFPAYFHEKTIYEQLNTCVGPGQFRQSTRGAT